MGNTCIIQQIFKHFSDSMKHFILVVRLVDSKRNIDEIESLF